MKRNLNPRVCRGCGLIFMPKTSLQRYGAEQCKLLPKTFTHKSASGQERHYGSFRSVAVSGATPTHPKDPS